MCYLLQLFFFYSFVQANVVKWEKAVTDDEKELEKVRNDESRHMKVTVICFFNPLCTNTQYSDKIHYNETLTDTKSSLKRWQLTIEFMHCI